MDNPYCSCELTRVRNHRIQKQAGQMSGPTIAGMRAQWGGRQLLARLLCCCTPPFQRR